MTSSKFSIKNLSLSLGEDEILKGVSLAISAGSVTSLIGPSGSGKSTLLRCLNRLWEPPAQSVFFDGADVTTIDPLVLRQRVGMLFQTSAMFAGTVADNIRYGPHLRDETLSDEKVATLLSMAGLLPEMATRFAKELSGGEGQRVALARALANNPEVLLLDEPTSALDPASTQRVEQTVLRLRDTLGLTVVWVSHTVEQVRRVADEVIFLANGSVVKIGSPDEVLTDNDAQIEAYFSVTGE